MPGQAQKRDSELIPVLQGPKDPFTLPCYAQCTCAGRSILSQLSIGVGEDFLKVEHLQEKLRPLFIKHFRVHRHPLKLGAVLHLEGQDAVAFQDVLDLSLAEGYSDVSHSVPCKRLMKKIAKHSGKLPRSFYLQPEGVYDIKRHPSRTRNARFYTGTLNGHLVMLKCLNLPSDSDDPRLRVDLYRETVIWRHLRHDNVLPFLGIYVIDSDWRLVAPYMINGDLRKYLDNETNRVGEEGLLLLIQQIIEGVSFLHSNGIIHADIKPENIFIDDRKRAVVGDIGLAFLSDGLYEPTRTASASRAISTGTVRYMAPELLHDKYHRSTVQTDVYALGMTMFDILTGQKPFQGSGENSIQNEVLKRKRPKQVYVSRYGGIIDRDVWELVSRCWEHKPSNRPSMSAIREQVNNLLKPPKEDHKRKRWRGFLGFFTRSRGGSYRQDSNKHPSAVAGRLPSEKGSTFDPVPANVGGDRPVPTVVTPNTRELSHSGGATLVSTNSDNLDYSSSLLRPIPVRPHSHSSSHSSSLPPSIRDVPLPFMSSRSPTPSSSSSPPSSLHSLSPSPYLVRPSEHHGDCISPWTAGPNYGPVLEPFLIRVLNINLQLNPLLHPLPNESSSEGGRDYLKWNMLFPSLYVQRSSDPPHVSWLKGRSEPATFPRVSFMRLVCHAMPYMIDIKARERDMGVTCGDLVDSVANSLYEVSVSDGAEFSALSHRKQRQISDAYQHNRSRKYSEPWARLGDEMRRVDWLAQKTIWDGVVSNDRLVRRICGDTLPATFELRCARRFPMTRDEAEVTG